MKAAPQSTADYYATINAIARFLLREGESGYVFAVVEDERILPEIFDILSSKATGRGKQLLFTRLMTESDQPIIQQILQPLEKHRKADALSIVGLDELLEKKPGTGQLTKTGQNRLLELNFARESLNRLGRPIVFWINPENQALLANQAADLFGQRRLSTFFFSYHPEVFDDNPFFQDRFQDGSHDPAAYERLKLRTNLLEKQLEEAESKNYPPGKIARDIVLPLAELYSDLDLHQRASELLDRYNPKIDWKSPDNLLKLGKIFHNARRYEEAVRFYKVAEQRLVADPGLHLCRTYSNLGDIYLETGQFTEALNYYEKDRRLSERLLEDNPNSGDHQQSLAITYERLGKIYQAQGKFKEALDYFKKDLQLTEELFQANPHSESLKNGLAISYSKLGDIYKAQGKFKEALDYFKKETDLFEELFQANPHNIDLENGLAISYYKLAEIYRSIPNSDTDPAPYYRRALEIWERMLQRTGWPKLEGYIEHVKGRLEAE